MEKQVLESPFTKKEFLNLVKQFNDNQDIFFDDFAISDKTIVNIGNRDFVDYRPTSDISTPTLKENAIAKINLDSLHFFQIQKIVENLVYKSISIKKSDTSINLILPNLYEDYLQNLTKKKSP